MAEATTRIYWIKSSYPDAQANPHTVDHLIEAKTKAGAYEHVCKRYVGEASVASAKDVAALVAAGVKVEVAG